MKLPKEHITTILLLHDSPNHAIPAKRVRRLNIDYPNIADHLQDLIQDDLVEYVLEEDIFYLAYDGFEFVERHRGVSRQKKVDPLHIDYDQFNQTYEALGAKKMQAVVFGIILVLVILAVVVKFELV